MAWQDTLYDASFRGVVFDYYSVEDSVDKTLATHQAPFSDDANISDMGNNPKRINITAIINGDDYEIHLEQLLQALEKNGVGELVHPVFGSQSVNVMSWNVKHDSELVDGCHIDMQFVVAKSERHYQKHKARISDEPMPQHAKQADMLIVSKPASELQVYQEQLATMSNPVAVTESRNIPEEIRKNLREVRTKLSTELVRIDELLSPPTWLGSIVNDIDGIVKMLPVDYNPMTNWRRLFNRIKSIGDVFQDSDVYTLRKLGTVMPAVMMSRAFLSVIDNELNSPVLSPKEIVSIADEVRSVCQTCIDDLRSIETPINNPNLPPNNNDVTGIIADIKTASAQVQVLTDRVVNMRPQLIQHVVTSPCTLRLLAHQLYKDTDRVPELARLNRGLVNPAIINVGVRLSVYAK